MTTPVPSLLPPCRDHAVPVRSSAGAPSSPPWGWLSTLAALVLVLSGIAATPFAQAVAADPASPATPVITRGHVALTFYPGGPEYGTPTIATTLDGNPLDPAAAIGVPDSTYTADLGGSGMPAASGYLLPGGGDAPLSLGWDLSAIQAESDDAPGAELLLSWTGPEDAQVLVSRHDQDGVRLPLLADGGYELAQSVQPGEGELSGASVLDVGSYSTAEEGALPVAGDASWVFTKPGTYTLSAVAVTDDSESLRSTAPTAPVAVMIQVGDEAIAGQSVNQPDDQVMGEPAPAEAPAAAREAEPAEATESAEPAQPAPSLEVEPVIAPGGDLDPWAEGFPEGATVEFLLDGVLIGTEVVWSGAAVLEYALPADIAPGQHTVQARSGSLSVSASFEVPGDPRPSVEPSAAPESGSDAPQCLPPGVTTVLDKGHVDMFDLVSDEQGSLSLKLKEDVTGYGVLHDPETVLLQVTDAAKRVLPTEVPGSAGDQEVYFLPQQQDQELLWPGWDTQSARAGGYERTRFDVSYTGPEGGRITMFLNGTFGGVQSRLADGTYELKPEGSTILQDYPAHTHVNWVFSTPGRYTLTVTATATTGDGTSVSAEPRTYVIDVGEVNCSGPTPEPQDPQEEGTQEGAASTGQGGGSAGASSGDTGSGARPGGAGDFVQPVSLPGASQAGGLQVPGAGAGPGGGSGRGKGSTVGQCLPTTVTREATAEEAKKLGKAGAKATGTPSDTPTGSPTAAAQGQGSGASDTVSASTTLTFSVGPDASGNASEGHFDLGPVVEDGHLAARIKDDRKQPASWVDPSTLTFALGDAASLTAPEDLSFVADTGSTVWMIPSTQIAGVPWLGMNSQREEIVNGTTGEVTFTLSAVDGPGKVAVFNAGSLGSGVGTHVFDGPGSSYVLPANTHAHQNWVFSAPGTYHLTITMSVTPTSGSIQGEGTDASGTSGASGKADSSSGRASNGLTPTGEKGPNGRPMVREVVGRTSTGEPCDLSLARTGTSPVPVVSASAAMVALGVLLLARRPGRRRSRVS